MVTALRNTGSEKNIIEVQDDLELKILSTDSSAKYSFFDFYDGLEYTGVTVTYNSGEFLFHDTRAFQQVGDTTINLSEEQAVDIAKEYVREYFYSWRAPNGTETCQTGFNASAVYTVYLESAAIGGTTLLPYWHVWLNVSDMPKPSQQGFELYLSAKDGAVAQIKTFQIPYRYTPPITDYQSPAMLLVAALLFPLIGGLVVVLIVLVVVLKVTSPKPAAAAQTGRANSYRVIGDLF